MSLVKKVGLVASLAGALFFLIAGSVQADFPPAAGDDDIPSLGKFTIAVHPDFRPLMTGYMLYDALTAELESPTMSDPSTRIGRSAPHAEGSAPDIGGALVGTGGTIISDGDFSIVPPVFAGTPSPRREVHTEIVSLNLLFGPAAVRAGPTPAPGRPVSPGEVQAQSTTGTPAEDFPADSFFNVFVEVDLPGGLGGAFPGGTLYNSTALLVINYDLLDPPGLPPRVVYVHGNSSAVPVLFLADNPGFWDADDLFGWLILSGHGVDYEPADIAEFEEIYAELTPMPTPGPVGGIAELPPLAETSVEGSAASADGSGWSAGAYSALAGGLAVALMAFGGGAWYARRRFSRS